ncbi:mechanosensitive ion channel family protein [Fulvivirga sediminis]|uniref:Mechanosensitive ion channel family protein n=1 Tax=Fulvivirga sediminis TaxID=2803949 RepID=A0A937F5S5_9BACT|nr:mechanosensitive ion channel family protein [Fulvivirga sediminis]MBL3655169.1 mechanosensitive ion channel family protein [Fulvivirga sediminis]
MSVIKGSFFKIRLSVVLLMLMSLSASAQFLGQPQVEKSEEEEEVPADSLGRRSPQGTVDGFMSAISAGRYKNAIAYFDLGGTYEASNDEATELVKSLVLMLDQGGSIFPNAWISDQDQGNLEDGLKKQIDKVGYVSVNNKNINLLLERKKDTEGNYIWLFSSETLLKIASEKENFKEPVINKLLPNFLLKNRRFGFSLGQWLAMGVIVALVYFCAVYLSKGLVFFVKKIWKKSKHESFLGIVDAFSLPLRLYLAIVLYLKVSKYLGISVVVRQQFSFVSVIVFWAAVLLLLWRIADFVAGFMERKMSLKGNLAAVSAIIFFRRAFYVSIIIIGVIMAIGALGFDITNWIAALGIGGIAIALGAQKTVENFVGSVTLVLDRPIRVGDFCKVAETMGTVEQIGMRSTKIRTLDRTIVTIPNGEFSSLKIENYTQRDMFWFHPVLSMRYETTPDQMRYLLVEIRKLLYAHPKVDPDPARIRFTGFGPDYLPLEIFAYVRTPDYNGYLEVKEDLLLRIMDIVEESGTGFAFPSQTIYMAKDEGVSSEKTEAIHAKVKEWREKEQMEIPNFTPEAIEALKGTITYPPEGSTQKNNG